MQSESHKQRDSIVHLNVYCVSKLTLSERYWNIADCSRRTELKCNFNLYAYTLLKKFYLKLLSRNRRQFCLGLNVLHRCWGGAFGALVSIYVAHDTTNMTTYPCHNISLTSLQPTGFNWSTVEGRGHVKTNIKTAWLQLIFLSPISEYCIIESPVGRSSREGGLDKHRRNNSVIPSWYRMRLENYGEKTFHIWVYTEQSI